jgi:hypothetical protein
LIQVLPFSAAAKNDWDETDAPISSIAKSDWLLACKNDVQKGWRHRGEKIKNDNARSNLFVIQTAKDPPNASSCEPTNAGSQTR